MMNIRNNDRLKIENKVNIQKKQRYLKANHYTLSIIFILFI